MKLKCKKCGEILSKVEEKEYYENMENAHAAGYPVEIICNDCFDMIENSPIEDEYEHFDCDPGL